MSAETNIATVRQYYEECANADGDPDKRRAFAVVDAILSPDFAMFYNSQSDAEAARGKAAHKAFLIGHMQAFPGERWTVERILADEQTVACQWRVEATHNETGNAMDLRGADFFTIRNGQLAELRRFLDFRTLMDQMQPRPPQQEAGV